MDTQAKPSRHPASARIDLDRIRENYRAIRLHAGPRAVIPVLKANAYGHGAVAVARTLEPMGVPLIAVAYVDEAIALRRAGIETPLLVLTGFAPDQIDLLFEFRLTPIVSTGEQVRALCALDPEEGHGMLGVHVKADTGMSRLGFSLREIEPMVHRLEDSGVVEIEGLMTHLASADEDAIATEGQLDLFDEAIMRLSALGVRPRLIHAANSAGLAFLRDTHTAVRPGLMLYGIPPRPLSPPLEVAPAMEFRARVARLSVVPAGTGVSYGGRFVTAQDTRIATLNAGYADGLPRTDGMRERGFARFGETRLPVAGTVCMDLTMLDASNAPTLVEGDEVTFFGDAPSAWEVAAWAGTNAWQVTTAVGPRVPRRYRLGGRDVSETLEPLD